VHHYQDLILLFNQCFAEEYNTKLFKGTEEPVYLPANESQLCNAIYFAHGFFSSALHECAHWFIAGKERRNLIDFGYWYAPDGRNPQQQVQFQSVEVKPQALEWILSHSCGYPFRVSIDNLNGGTCDTENFKQSIHQQVLTYCRDGLPRRAQKFRLTLCKHYKKSESLSAHEFLLADLR
jgi:elongation factor P hydroxylase